MVLTLPILFELIIFAFLGPVVFIYVRSRINQLTYQNRLLKALRSLDIAAISTVEIEPLSQAVVNVVRKELGYFFGVIALIDNNQSGIKRIAISYNTQLEEFLKTLPIKFKEQVVPFSSKDNLFIKVIDQKEGIFTPNLQDIQRGVVPPEISDKIQKTFNLKGVFLYPLISKNKVIGVIEYPSTIERDKVSRFEFTIMEEFTAEVARVLDNVMLYQQLRDTTQKLTQANQRLKELDQRKDDFVSIASHELRTPMTAIRSYAWMALHKPDIPLSVKMKKYLDRTLISTERLINLVNDMLNISRIESGKVEILPAQFDIQQLAADVLIEVEVKAKEKKLKLKLNKTQLPLVFADPDKVHQVLLNLIGNSLKFTPEEGLIEVDFFSDGQVVEVGVKDTGVGISKENISKLFEKFGRLDSSYVMAATTGGTGLGLYISRSLITLMGGKIWVQSEGLGKGSTFCFSLPVANRKVLAEADRYTRKVGEGAKPLEPVAI